MEWPFVLNAVGFLKKWHFDLLSSMLSVIFLPFLVYFLSAAKRLVFYWGRYVVDGILYKVSGFANAHLAAIFSIKKYARLKLSGENKYLYVPSNSLDVKLELDNVFIPLAIESSQGAKQTYDHADIFSVGNRIRIIGDPGSGKSSLVKKIMRDACKNALTAPTHAQLPIFVELKTLSVPEPTNEFNIDEWLFLKIKSDVLRNNIYKIEDCFNSYVQEKGLLVLLDGLDEVSSKQYPLVSVAINKLSEYLGSKSENNILLLTMRTQFHQQVKEEYRENFGMAYFIKPFTPTDIYKFLIRWPFQEKGRENRARIYKELSDKPSLKEMCGNPLILAMYVAEDQSKGHLVTPDSRTEFYKAITEELIITRRQRQIGSGVAHTKLKEQREQILGRLAYKNILDAGQPTNSLEWRDAIEITCEVLGCDPEAADKAFREIERETGLITEERPRETLRFIHLTFCEFLSALEAVQGQRNGWKSFVATHRKFKNSKQYGLKTRLAEAIPFAAGLMPRVDKNSAILDVYDIGDCDLLSRCFLETKIYENVCWQKFVDTQRDYFLSAPENLWGPVWLRKLHLFNTVVRDACQCASHTGLIKIKFDFDDFYRVLVSRQRDSLFKLLDSYAQQDAVAVFRLGDVCGLDLAKNFPDIIIKNCDQHPFLALVLEAALREESRADVWAPLIAEAGLRSELVRRYLCEEDWSDIWGGVLSKIPKSEQWNTAPFPDNAYTRAISVSLLPLMKISPSFKFLLAVKKFRLREVLHWSQGRQIYSVLRCCF